MSEPIVPAPLPRGVALVPFDHTVAQSCRELLNRVYAEGFGDVVPYQSWWSRLSADPEYDPALSFVAMADAEIVGFCQCWTEPFIKDIAVDARWRGRSIGGGLLTVALQTYAASGAAFVDLKTDVDNHAAQSLYQRLGFTIVERLG